MPYGLTKITAAISNTYARRDHATVTAEARRRGLNALADAHPIEGSWGHRRIDRQTKAMLDALGLDWSWVTTQYHTPAHRRVDAKAEHPRQDDE